MLRNCTFEIFDIDSGERIYRNNSLLPELRFNKTARTVNSHFETVASSFLRGTAKGRNLRLVVDISNSSVLPVEKELF